MDKELQHCPVCLKRGASINTTNYTLDTSGFTYVDCDGVLHTHFECSCEVCQFSYSGDFTRQIPLE